MNTEYINTRSDFGEAKTLRWISIIGFGYIMISVMIDILIRVPPLFIVAYYAALLVLIGLFLSLSFVGKSYLRIGNKPLFLIISFITALVLLTCHYIASWFGYFPKINPESIVLRSLPLLVVVVVIIAWFYSRKYIVGFCFGLLVIQSIQILFFNKQLMLPASHIILVVVAQTSVCLILGFTVEMLVSKIQQQQRSLKQMNDQLIRQANTQQQLIISRERNRMARELHDTLAHTLSGLTVQLETVKAYWEVDSLTAQNMLENSLTTAREGLKETRLALKALLAGPLEDLGLGLAIKHLVDSAIEQTNMQCEYLIPEQIPALDPEYDQCIYRISQEAIANIVQHAGASQMTLRFSFDRDRIDLKVKDNGRGFKYEDQDTSDHFGLSGIRERAELIGGKLKIESAPEKGTTIHFTKKL
jgi:signal transduction histidine kinase